MIIHFEEYYGYRPEVISYAPGQLDLIGGYTRQSAGYALSMAIDRAMWVAAARRDDHTLNIYIPAEERHASFSITDMENAALPYQAYAAGGVWYLLSVNGTDLPGADLLIEGNIPSDRGLSSTAAVDLALLEAGLALANVVWSQEDKVRVTEKLTREIFNRESIRNSAVAIAGKEGYGLLVDYHNNRVTPVRLPESVAIVALNLVDLPDTMQKIYRDRQVEVRQAVQRLNISALHELDMEMVQSRQHLLGNTLYRRVSHILTEKVRVLAAMAMLHMGDLLNTGLLLDESHFSLRDYYGVSLDALDMVTQIAREQLECYGACLTGTGGEGCAVALVDATRLETFIDNVRSEYFSQSGQQIELYTFQAAAGSGSYRV